MKTENDLVALEAVSVPDFQKIFQTRMHDLDFNKHVNNSVYAVWAIESVPHDIMTTHALRKIIINYIGESLHGDRIQSNTQQLAANPSRIFLHSLISEQTGKEITRVKTVWADHQND